MVRSVAAVVAAILVLASCGAAGVSSSGQVAAPIEPPITTTSSTATSTTSTSTTTTTFGLTTTTTLPPWEPTLTCFEEPPPPYGPTEYEFDPEFYVHWCSASGIPVIGSAAVPLMAIEAAGQLINGVIGYDRVNTTETIANGGLVILYGEGETASDLPEWSFVEGQTQQLSDDHPGFTASGGGLTFSVVVWDDPVCAVPPERQNAYGTAEWGSVLVHELGHLAAGPAIRTRLVGFADNITVAYEAALEGSAWDNRTYAMSNPAEYWAEATQIYFGQYDDSTRGFRHPRTRVELAEQDPLVTTLLGTVFGDTTGIGTYWCSVYEGPVTLLSENGDEDEYAPVP